MGEVMDGDNEGTFAKDRDVVMRRAEDSCTMRDKWQPRLLDQRINVAIHLNDPIAKGGDGLNVSGHGDAGEQGVRKFLL